MADFEQGDVVVLKSGSMRMIVEGVEDDAVRVLWANEGQIGRETLPAFALNKWEDRGPSDRSGPRKSFGDKPERKPYRSRDDDDRGERKPYERRDRDEGDRPARPPRAPRGMDGKPRQKTFYRKDE